MKLADQPYSKVEVKQANTAKPVCVMGAPGLKPALSQANHNTPANPTAKPRTRPGPGRSLSHHHATTAPNKGVDALKMDDNPAVMDKAA